MAVKNELYRRVGETDELESDGVDADGVELVGAGHLEDLRLGKSGTGKVGGRFGAGEKMLANVRGADQFDASVIADSGVLQLDDLGDFRVRSIEPFELLNVAGPHARLVQRTVVRERMLVATRHREGTRTEKQLLVPHIYIVGGGKRETAACAWVIPGKKDRSKKRRLNLVDAFDAENTGHFSNVGENGFELAAVDNFEAGLDAGVLAVGAAFETADVGTRTTDDCGDFR